MASSRIPLQTRLQALSIPEPNTGCWLWLGDVRPGGYGRLHVDGHSVSAHRLAFELSHGPIPAGLFVCHRCDTKLCVNPDHLFAGTHQENQTDKARKCRSPRSRKGLPFGAHPATGDRGPYLARVTVCGKRYSAGSFATAQEASAAALELKARLVPGFNPVDSRK